MKTITAIICLAAFSNYCNAQKLKAAAVPVAVQKTFTEKFPGSSNVTWEKEKTDYEVNFKQGNKEKSALINANGSLVETEIEISITELPKPIAEYVSKNYGKVTIKEAAIITDQNGKVTYEAEVNKKDLLFDANGNFIKSDK